jgi:hypothetical protein
MSQAWTIFIESLRISVASVRFTSSHRASISSQVDMPTANEKMRELDNWVVLTTAKAEANLPMSVLDLDRTGMDWTGFRLICFGLD